MNNDELRNMILEEIHDYFRDLKHMLVECQVALCLECDKIPYEYIPYLIIRTECLRTSIDRYEKLITSMLESAMFECEVDCRICLKDIVSFTNSIYSQWDVINNEFLNIE